LLPAGLDYRVSYQYLSVFEPKLIMSLKTDVPDITYTAGSKVTGTVITTTNVDIEKIWIKFIGRGHSTLQFFNPNLPDYDFPPKLHNENVLFVDEKILFEGPDIVHGPRSWTFNFEFPYIGNIF